jgi:hypothetical protein
MGHHSVDAETQSWHVGIYGTLYGVVDNLFKLL